MSLTFVTKSDGFMCFKSLRQTKQCSFLLDTFFNQKFGYAITVTVVIKDRLVKPDEKRYFIIGPPSYKTSFLIILIYTEGKKLSN